MEQQKYPNPDKMMALRNMADDLAYEDCKTKQTQITTFFSKE